MRRGSTSCCAPTATRPRSRTGAPARATSSAQPEPERTAGRKAAILLNARAGTLARLGCAETAALVTRVLGAHDIAGEIAIVEGAAFRRTLRDVLGRGVDFVLVGGGDGTINAAAALLAGTGCPLGILPLGTFNHLAKELLVPPGLADSLAALVDAVPEALDIAEVNGRIFVSHSALGIYPRMVRHRDLQRARFGRRKWLAMAIACAAALREYPTLGLQIRVGGEALRRRSPFVFVGNNRYILGSYGVAPSPRRDRLTLAVAHDVGRGRLLRMGIEAMAGRLSLDGAADTFDLATAEIHSRRRHLRVEVDGEVCMLEPPLCYRLLPRGLTVLRPRGPEFVPPSTVHSAWNGIVSGAAGGGSRAA